MVVNKRSFSAPQSLLESNLPFSNDEPALTGITITREQCVDQSLIDSFLRFLRHGSDDTIRQKLNNYRRAPSDGGNKCKEFLKQELYPNWQIRNNIISFCEKEAAEMKAETDQRSNGTGKSSTDSIIDARLDPYAAREQIEEQESRYKDLNKVRNWVANNRKIEQILTSVTARILRQNCDQNEDYLKQFTQFCKDNT
ncbi:YBL107C [Saccharomyces arboricola H-6]|uniref:YBL107C n=1 Tax=Saccharomyces arboricola (strain H-6 / AS 2.3317 / CBS 10644) TaxID=1160507 RepID=J8PRB6_SACAR|nr:YBL107C [Saccharomyces arboricola H-6]